MNDFTYLKDCKNKEEIIREFFSWLFDEPNINLITEVDLTLASQYYDPYIYYPQKINDFFNTAAMQRLNRVNQLGSVLKINPNCYHNRLDHSKGTYNRKVEELIYQTQDLNYRKYIENNNLKLYLIAELIKEAAHDIGHLPLSHVMETTVIEKRGFHEEIGEKILTEDSEIKHILTSISPKLPEILNESLLTDILNSKTHDESNYDIDRLDYLNRDSLYLGFPIDFKVEPYEISFAKTDEDGNIMYNADGSVILADKSDTNKKRLDIYSNENLKTIENFLTQRLTSYRQTYFSPENQVLDTSVGNFLTALLSSPDRNLVNTDLLNLIEKLKTHSLDNISVSELTKFDDLTFYRDLINIAENSSDKNMREFSSLILPSLNSLMDFVYSSLNMTKSSSLSDFSDIDLKFIQKIKYLIHSNDELGQNLRNPDFLSSNFIYEKDPSKIEELQSKWSSNINITSSTVYAYKTKYPIYIKDKTGKVFTLDKHPERTCDWDTKSETLTCAFAFIPELRLQGLDEKAIQEITADFNTFPTPKTPSTYETNMSLLQVGHSMNDYFDELEI